MKRPRIVHVCAFDRGGAANSALRLHRDLRAAGFDSQVVVAVKKGNEAHVHEVPGWLHRWTWPHVTTLDYRLGRLVCPARLRYGTPSLVPGFAARFIEELQPDIVHLHWVAASFLSIAQIGRIPHPVVWTLHDMWALTPGYNYRVDARAALGGIDAFRPLLPEGPFRALGENIWRRKLRAWSRMKSIVVAPSRWLAEEARRSEIFREREVLTIPYSVPLEVFRPGDRPTLRRSLGLPEDRTLLLSGADGAFYRKGVDLLDTALRLARDRLGPSIPPLSVVLFGRDSEGWLRECGVDLVHFGVVESEAKMAALFAACDVFACPSREDNLPNTILESLACGTPAVGFRIGGLPDLIQDGVNGFLAEPFDATQLAANLVQTIELQRQGLSLGTAARRLAEERYTPDQTSLRYVDLYDRLAGA